MSVAGDKQGKDLSMALFNSQGGYLIPSELPLSTKKGTKIPNEQRGQRPPAAMQAAENIMRNGRPSVRTRSLRSGYNCMGMIFASRRTCIDPDKLRMILEEDDYRQIGEEGNVECGDVVVYKGNSGSVTHVGIVVEARPDLFSGIWKITVLSQWGGDGEYLHLIDEVHPSLGEPSEFWTDRT